MKQLIKLTLPALTGLILNIEIGTWSSFAQCNVALNKPATASGSYTTYTPDKAFDGNTSLFSKWVQGGGAPGWIQVDLGAQYTVDNIQLVVEQVPDGNTVYEIYTSSDMSTWTLIETISQYTSQSQVLSRVYSPQLIFVQGVKIVTTNSAGSWVAWREIEVNTCPALPIELLSFDATSVKDNNNKYYVRCEWSTASEINNDYFAIENSRDGKTFAQIGKADGAGNSSKTLHYRFDDQLPYTDLSYYRLKQTDYDGKSSYSNIVPVYIGTLEIISIYPNPAEKVVTTKIAVQENTEATTEVFNILGEQVIVQSTTLKKGVTEVIINTQALASGTYTFRITLPDKEHMQKMFVK